MPYRRKYSCKKCHRNCKRNSIFCGQCKSWIHQKCATLSDEQFQLISQIDSEYICVECHRDNNGTVRFAEIVQRLTKVCSVYFCWCLFVTEAKLYAHIFVIVSHKQTWILFGRTLGEAYLSAIAIAKTSVRPFVRSSHGWIVARRVNRFSSFLAGNKGRPLLPTEG